ncbi:MAG: hypothetical protein ACRD99_00470 [Nitrososphaera sp.]
MSALRFILEPQSPNTAKHCKNILAIMSTIVTEIKCRDNYPRILGIGQLHSGNFAASVMALFKKLYLVIECMNACLPMIADAVLIDAGAD